MLTYTMNTVQRIPVKFLNNYRHSIMYLSIMTEKDLDYSSDAGR